MLPHIETENSMIKKLKFVEFILKNVFMNYKLYKAKANTKL